MPKHFSHTEIIGLSSHEPSDAFKSSPFNYTTNERIVSSLAEQIGREKMRYYSNDTGLTLDCPIKGHNSRHSNALLKSTHILHNFYLIFPFFASIWTILGRGWAAKRFLTLTLSKLSNNWFISFEPSIYLLSDFDVNWNDCLTQSVAERLPNH